MLLRFDPFRVFDQPGREVPADTTGITSGWMPMDTESAKPHRIRITAREPKAIAAATLVPPRPRHEVIVLVDELDKATVNALGYARTLRPLALTAVHVAVDPAHARALADRWAHLELDVPLEVVDCADRDLPGTVRQALAERTRPDTAVTVIIPQHRYGGLLDRVLHDQTAQHLLRALEDLDEVYVTVVPYHVGPRRRRAPATGRRRRHPVPRWAPAITPLVAG